MQYFFLFAYANAANVFHAKNRVPRNQHNSALTRCILIFLDFMWANLIRYGLVACLLVKVQDSCPQQRIPHKTNPLFSRLAFTRKVKATRGVYFRLRIIIGMVNSVNNAWFNIMTCGARCHWSERVWDLRCCRPIHKGMFKLWYFLLLLLFAIRGVNWGF